jgi:acetyl esterase/lipase
VEECYTWLVEESGRVKSGDQVSVLGISSGGGVALSLIQKMAAKPKKYQPRAAVLISPWVHYDWENLYPSLSENAAHDLIVTQQVFNYVLPCSPQMAGGVENRTTCSPLGKSCEGVCPALIVCSEHEATTDEDLALFDKMKKQGVDVTLHSYK